MIQTSTYRERKEIIEGKMSTLIAGRPALMIDKRFCKVAIDGFLGGYHYPVKREEQQFEGRFELPFKDGFYEHIMNSGEYIAVNMFKDFYIRKNRYDLDIPIQTQTYDPLKPVGVYQPV